MDAQAEVERLGALYAPRDRAQDPANDTRVAQLRLPPQSIEAEQAVLGGLMLAPDSWENIADQLSDNDFYRRDHALIFRAIRELAEKSRPFDAVTLGEWFESQGLSEEVAGGAYLIELASNTPSAANITAYAEIVRDKAILRQLIDVGTGIVNDGFQPNGRDTAEILTEAQRNVTQLASTADRDRGGLVLMRAGLKDAYNDLLGFYNGTRAPGIPLPWGAVRKFVRGMGDTDLIILAGRPGMGKSVGGQEIAFDVAKNEGPVAMYSPEMSRQQLIMRRVSSRTGIPMDRLMQEGGIEDHEWDKVTAAFEEIRALPIAVDDSPDLTIHQVRHRARRMHREYMKNGGRGLRCVVVDYLQLLQGSGKGEKRHDEISEISRGLKLMAKELKCPVVALSQLNRSLETRTNKRPTMADLRESGAIEQDADLILFLYRDDYYNEASNAPGCLEVIIGKQRSGATGTAYVKHELPCYRFGEWEGGRPVYDLAEAPRARRSKFGSGKGRAAAAGDE